MIYGKNTTGSQQKTIPISQITQSQLFLKISFYFLQISLIFHPISLIAKSVQLNYYIRYVLIPILHKVQEMVAVSTSMVTVPLSKTDFAQLNATHQALGNIHTQMLKHPQTKIS